MSRGHWTPGQAATEPIFDWWCRFCDVQHAFRDASLRSVCEQLRWTAHLERGENAPICPDCRRIVWDLTGSARDHIVDGEAAADAADTELRQRLGAHIG